MTKSELRIKVEDEIREFVKHQKDGAYAVQWHAKEIVEMIEKDLWERGIFLYTKETSPEKEQV